MKYLIGIFAFFISIILLSCSENISDNLTGLTDQEKTDLLYSREEEKLARDVYLNSVDLYGHFVFQNISQSEQRHMDEILLLLNEYGLEDPALQERGVFKNDALQQLYNQLTEQSSISLKDAFLAGAKIEDMDINDLENQLSRTSKQDILNAYEMLLCGSGNHMRAFNTQLTNMGEAYTPEFIPSDNFESIINGNHEQCGR